MNTVPKESTPVPAIHPATAAQAPAWFDAGFYLENNPGVACDAASAWAHCRDHGWREFRNPSPGFDVWWYQAEHLEGDHTRDPLRHYLEVGHAAGLSTGPVPGVLPQVAEKSRFNLRTLALLNGLEAPAAVFARIASNLAALRLWDVADMFAARACDLRPDVADYHALLGSIVARRNGWWRVVLAMRSATSLEPGRADWWHALGVACERLGRLDEAAEAYARSLALAGDAIDTRYRLGRVEEQRGNTRAAEAHYAQVVADTPALARAGIGLRHEQEKDWCGAEAGYRRQLSLPAHAGDGALHFAHGRMLEVLYRWEEAAEAYASAIALDPSHPEWHYRHGWMLERLGQPVEAATSYTRALALRDEADWRYRLGTCLHAAGDMAAAITAWLRCVPDEPMELPAARVDDEARRATLVGRLRENCVDAAVHFELGACCERLGRYDDAAAAYLAAVQRQDELIPGWYFRLGRALHQAGRGAEACEAFLSTRLYRRDFSIVPAPELLPGQPEPPRDIKGEYAEFIETLPVRDDVVLYESFHGDSVSCNPLAVFRAARERFGAGARLHVWAVMNRDSIPADLAAMPDVVFITHGSTGYLRYLATAGWLVNNNTFMPYFVRRTGQRYLNTWHGTPLKKLGQDIPRALFDHKNAVRNLLQATHLAMPNAFTRARLLSSMQVDRVIDARIADTGQARIDMMLGAGEERRAQLRERLGLAGDAKVVLYAPTWRGSLAGASLDAELVSVAIERLAASGASVLFSLHHMVAQALGELPAGATAIPAGMDITEVLSVVDVLVTDYSSVLFDFLPSGRPVLLYTPDMEQYRRDRGLYLDPSALPVTTCATAEALEQALAAALRGEAVADAARAEAARREYWPLEDGNAAKRAVAFFFDGDTRHEAPRPRRSERALLFYAGNFSPNGVTASFNRLAQSVDPERVAMAVIVDPWTMESYPQRLERFADLPPHVARWGRISYPVGTREQGWLNARQGGREVLNPRQLSLLETYYRREFSRQFGSARFDAVVDFSGYAPFWASLFARGRPGSARCVAYLHNDMELERNHRHPQLAKVFEQYPLCDALVSVSESIAEVNRQQFGGRPDQHPDRFHSVDNCIAPAAIREGARQPLPEGLEAWREDHVLLGTVGRLSPEKGHRRLLEAFAIVHRDHPRVKLVIVGDGPERPALQNLVIQLGLQEHVTLTGALANPYPVMKALDLFVLSSLYEGQGIVLLEALALGRPVLSTDIPGPRSVLADGSGRLVPDSTEGLVQGITDWLASPRQGEAWDAEAYCRRAVEQFERVVAGLH